MQCHETETIDHPYEKFLAGQKQRENFWKSTKAKVAKTQAPTTNTTNSASPSLQQLQDDVVAVLRQQLAAKTDECRHLINRLDAVEEANKKILAHQMQMQENLNKVMYYL